LVDLSLARRGIEDIEILSDISPNGALSFIFDATVADDVDDILGIPVFGRDNESSRDERGLRMRVLAAPENIRGRPGVILGSTDTLSMAKIIDKAQVSFYLSNI